MIVGSGKFRYRVNADWAKLPAGWSFKEVGGVGVDRNDNVYVFNRGEHPMMVFDREGNFLRSWGEGQYPRAHGVHMAPDDTMFLTDDGGHFVRKVTLDGKVLLELGVPGKPAPYMSGEPFHRCTHTALSPQGHIYVSDGYGNSRVHKYTPDGKLLMSWGEPGTGEGEFNIVHNICCDADGWVYVADRENHRVQVFDGNGKFETQWQNLPGASRKPCAPATAVGAYGSSHRRARRLWRAHGARTPRLHRAPSTALAISACPCCYGNRRAHRRDGGRSTTRRRPSTSPP
jgi:outer membrane protein assembly factor BamB